MLYRLQQRTNNTYKLQWQFSRVGWNACKQGKVSDSGQSGDHQDDPYIHTYIIGHYNPSAKIIDLVSHTTYVVCVNFIHKWRDLQFTVDSERHIFWKTFHGNFILLSEFLPEICWGEIVEEIFLYFVLDVLPGARTLAFRLISQHTTY